MGLLTPDSGLLFWMVVCFGVVFFILAKYAFPVIINAVDKRKKYIDSSLEAARQANEQLQQAKTEVESLLAEARRQQTAILKEAAATRDQIIADARNRAREEARKALDETRQQIAAEKESAGRQIYKHLMNGVSHMLPFVIGGGILIALAFLLDDFDPNNAANFGMGTPIAAFFKTIGGVAFNFMLPILAGYIAMSIADRPGLVVGFVGGSMAAAGTSFATIAGTADPVSSGFLGALLAGFVGGYFMLAFEKLCEKLPRSLEGIKPILLYPVVGVLFMGLFMCAFGPIVGALNTGLTSFLSSLGGTSKILLGAVLGGMMSIDMGGPFNKAAYVTGTGAIATALAAGAGQGAIEYQMMASVMVGGMVPPIAIALCTTFFKKKFTADERKSGVVNYIMGLCFISEGAIPFAAADPLRVIPSCVVGSAVAGALSMVFGCGLMAPHGGIFVFPVVSNVMGYLLSLVAGSVVGMALLAVLKKNKEA